MQTATLTVTPGTPDARASRPLAITRSMANVLQLTLQTAAGAAVDLSGVMAWEMGITQDFYAVTPVLAGSSSITAADNVLTVALSGATLQLAQFLDGKRSAMGFATLKGFNGESALVQAYVMPVTLCNIGYDADILPDAVLELYWTAAQTEAKLADIAGALEIPTDLSDLTDNEGLLAAKADIEQALPPGGAAGDILHKTTSEDYAAGWTDAAALLSLTMKPGYADPITQGMLAWNAADGTLDLGLNGGDVVMQIGQETLYRVENGTGSAIANGTLVMSAGTVGNSGRMRVAPWDGTKPPQAILGLATEEILAGQLGYVTRFGRVRGIDTTGGAENWQNGDTIYAGASGGMTNVRPVAPNTKTIIGQIINAHAQVGTMFVRPTFSPSLAFDDMVELGTLAENDILAYNLANQRFQNVPRNPSALTPLTGTSVTVVPFQQYYWNAAGTCTLTVSGFAATGLQSSALLIDVAAGATFAVSGATVAEDDAISGAGQYMVYLINQNGTVYFRIANYTEAV